MKVSLDTLHSEKHSLSEVGRWMWQALRRNHRQALFNIVLGMTSVLTSFAFILITKLTIDLATGNEGGSETLSQFGAGAVYHWMFTHTTLRMAACGLVAVILLQLVINISNRWVKALLGVKAQNYMQQHMFNRLLRSQWEGMERHHSGDTLNRLEKDVNDVVNTVTETVPDFVTVLFQLAGAFVFLYLMDSRLALFTIVAIPVVLVISKAYLRRVRVLTKEVRGCDSQVQALLQESVQHRMIIKTLEQGPLMLTRLQQLHQGLRRKVVRKTRISTISSAILSLGFSSVYLVTFLWGAMRLHEGTISYGSMIAFMQLVGQIQGPFRSLTSFIPSFIGTITACERLMELEEVPEEHDEERHFMEGPVGLHIENVTYAYTPTSRKILQNLSFDFAPGTHTAILGETGAGKTTLIRLILALVRPDEGKVKLYNNKESVLGQTATRCNFVYVPQGNTLFSGTIRDNLRMGDVHATDNQMFEALKDACADFVQDLPEGLDTLCGEQGAGLSEGQAQRIAIARALLRPGQIYLLDEATSALDMDTERRLLKNLSERLEGKTLIFVTHRTAVIDRCHQVLKVERTKK